MPEASIGYPRATAFGGYKGNKLNKSGGNPRKAGLPPCGCVERTLLSAAFDFDLRLLVETNQEQRQGSIAGQFLLSHSGDGYEPNDAFGVLEDQSG